MGEKKIKVLFVSHVANFQKFNNPYIKWFQSKGATVHYASLDDEEMKQADLFHKIDFRRDPFNPMNIKAFFQLVTLFRRERFDLIHCHTPIGGILTRLAAVFVPKTKIIYTAHGFHFFKGAPLKNFLVYKTAERLMAHRTDALITINEEDYQSAKDFRLRRGGKLYYLNGVGVDTGAVRAAGSDSLSLEVLRKEIGIRAGEFIVLTVAELIPRKNYDTALEAFLKADIPDSRYLICGRGTEEQRLKEKCRTMGIQDRVIFLGYRSDIYKIINISDVFLFTSHQEGLPISVIEAMAGGLPCVVSDIRGNDQLVDSKNGYILPDNDIDGFADALTELYSEPVKRQVMGECSAERAGEYDISKAVERMGEIYGAVLNM